MRFYYLGPFRLPDGDAAAARVLNVARAMRLAGHSVTFISWGGEERMQNLGVDGLYRVDGFNYIVTNELDPKGNLFNRVKSKFTRGDKTKILLQDRIGTYDAIITYNGSMTRWLLSFTQKYHIKLINDITEWYDYRELKAIDWIPYAINMFCTQKKVYNKIVISHYLDRYYDTSHSVVIPAICDSSETKWHIGKEKALETAGSFDGITLIYAGNPARKDAIHYAINAVQRLIDERANVRFLIVGIDRKRYLNYYSNQLSTTDISERIQFLGRVPQNEVPSYYALADFMVLLREPTRKSNAGFPTKFAESFTSGTPVIANLTSDLGCYLKDGETGFVVENPSEESVYKTLKNHVINLSPEEIEHMKFNVKQEATRLDYHHFVEPLREFMNNL